MSDLSCNGSVDGCAYDMRDRPGSDLQGVWLTQVDTRGAVARLRHRHAGAGVMEGLVGRTVRANGSWWQELEPRRLDGDLMKL